MPGTRNARPKAWRGVLAERRARADIVFLPSRPDLAARFANLALERGIETAYVRIVDRATRARRARRRVRAVAVPAADSRARRIRAHPRRRADALHRQDAATPPGASEVSWSRPAARTSTPKRSWATLWPEADGAAAKSSFDSALVPLAQAPRHRQCDRPFVRANVDRAYARVDGRLGARGGARPMRAQRRGRSGDRCAAAARRLSRAAPGRRRKPVDREAARRAACRDSCRALMELGAAARARGRLDRSDRRLSPRARSRQSRRVVLPRAHARARRDRRPRRSARTRSAAAASSCRSFSASSRPRKPSACTARSWPATRIGKASAV